MAKCALTCDRCGAIEGGFWDSGDSCPIGAYKDSSRYYDPGESKSGAIWRIDGLCRYYGIARAERLNAKRFVES